MMTFKARRVFAWKQWRNVNDLIISLYSDDRLPMESRGHILKSKDYVTTIQQWEEMLSVWKNYSTLYEAIWQEIEPIFTAFLFK